MGRINGGLIGVVNDPSGGSDSNSAKGIWSINELAKGIQGNDWPILVAIVEYLVIAGGGGGGLGNTTGGSGERGAGGGAGGYRTSVIGDFSGGNSTAEPLRSILTGSGSYTVTVGAGGAYRENGNNSQFLDIISLGGGAGAHKFSNENGSAYRGASGGSGGGSMRFAYAGGSGTSGQGFAGGDCTEFTSAGGGGGAGGPGGSTTSSGANGIGLVSSIDGLAIERAIGGEVATALSGSANLGEGGGGSTADAGNGGPGGSGVVILRTLGAASATTGSPTVTTDGSYNIYTFTASGSITF